MTPSTNRGRACMSSAGTRGSSKTMCPAPRASPDPPARVRPPGASAGDAAPATSPVEELAAELAGGEAGRGHLGRGGLSGGSVNGGRLGGGSVNHAGGRGEGGRAGVVPPVRVGRRPGGPGGHGRRSIHRAFCSPIGLSELGFAHDSRPTVRDDPHLSVLFVKIRTFTAVLWSVRFRVRFGSASLPRDGDRKPPPPPARLPRHA